MKIRYKIFLIMCICLLYSLKTQASTLKNGIENFPTEYQGYLLELSKKHPKWIFTALYTDLDWDYVINNQNVFGKNLVPINYSNRWKNLTEGEYNIEVDEGWVDCSRQALEYCIDPRNFLNEQRIFQFEMLSYSENDENLEAIEKILYGTEFYNTKVSYFDNSGIKIDMDEKYSDLILKAGKISRVSTFHLASRIKQEVGPFLSHSSISGVVEGFKGYYNFYNIGATSSAEPLGAVKNGLQYAKDGKGASQEIRSRYLIPWNTKEKAITGGAIFIGASYINAGQNTIYQEKFDIVGDSLFWHQYMTNILAPYNESKSIYNAYSKAEILDTSLNFIIPVYSNMPSIQIDNPNISIENYTEDNTQCYCSGTNVNIRTGPSTSYEIITSISKNTIMRRIKEGISEEWDKVILENGIIGYINNKYIKEIDIKIDFTDLRLEESQISKITKNTVSEIRKKIITDFYYEILNNKDEVLSENDLVGTGSKIVIKDSNGDDLRQYRIIIYGDINGDGKINSLDLIKLQRHILEIELLNDVYIESADVKKDGRKPNSKDLFLIQRHILEIQEINQ